MATHYTAVVTVHRTTHVTPAPSSSYGRNDPRPEPARESVDEIAKVVVRASTVEQLRAKVAAHVELIEEA